MDNMIFNVNGDSFERLELAIQLAANDHRFEGCIFHKDYGLIWLWTDMEGASKFPVPLSVKQVAEITYNWLGSDNAKSMECVDWDADADHDGSNRRGWRAYVEDWGHVGPADYRAIVAIRPAYIWYGK